jgi:hypothetical protein
VEKVIVIPMAGMSRRFSEAGYSRPKYELQAHGHSLFYWSVASFRKYFDSEYFLFVARRGCGVPAFIEAECSALGIKNFEVVELESPTRGQAETVYLGLKAAQGRAAKEFRQALLVFNIDTIRPGYQFPSEVMLSDGYIETFDGVGDGWSFAKTSAPYSNRVIRTSEKSRISDHCSTGLYYFRSVELFLGVYEEIASQSAEEFMREWKELYIAPMYNLMIEKCMLIQLHEIDCRDVVFSGVPAEYEAFKSSKQPEGWV